MAAGHSELTYIWVYGDTASRRMTEIQLACFNYCCRFINMLGVKKKKKKGGRNHFSWAETLIFYKTWRLWYTRVFITDRQTHTGMLKPHMPSPRSSTTLGPPRLSGHYAFSKLSVQREHEGERGVIFNMSTVPDPWRWWAGDCVQTPHHVGKTPISSTDFYFCAGVGGEEKKSTRKSPPTGAGLEENTTNV